MGNASLCVNCLSAVPQNAKLRKGAQHPTEIQKEKKSTGGHYRVHILFKQLGDSREAGVKRF